MVDFAPEQMGSVDPLGSGTPWSIQMNVSIRTETPGEIQFTTGLQSGFQAPGTGFGGNGVSWYYPHQQQQLMLTEGNLPQQAALVAMHPSTSISHSSLSCPAANSRPKIESVNTSKEDLKQVKPGFEDKKSSDRRRHSSRHRSKARGDSADDSGHQSPASERKHRRSKSAGPRRSDLEPQDRGTSTKVDHNHRSHHRRTQSGDRESYHRPRSKKGQPNESHGPPEVGMGLNDGLRRVGDHRGSSRLSGSVSGNSSHMASNPRTMRQHIQEDTLTASSSQHSRSQTSLTESASTSTLDGSSTQRRYQSHRPAQPMVHPKAQSKTLVNSEIQTETAFILSASKFEQLRPSAAQNYPKSAQMLPSLPSPPTLRKMTQPLASSGAHFRESMLHTQGKKLRNGFSTEFSYSDIQYHEELIRPPATEICLDDADAMAMRKDSSGFRYRQFRNSHVLRRDIPVPDGFDPVEWTRTNATFLHSATPLSSARVTNLEEPLNPVFSVFPSNKKPVSIQKQIAKHTPFVYELEEDYNAPLGMANFGAQTEFSTTVDDCESSIDSDDRSIIKSINDRSDRSINQNADDEIMVQTDQSRSTAALINNNQTKSIIGNRSNINNDLSLAQLLGPDLGQGAQNMQALVGLGETFKQVLDKLAADVSRHLAERAASGPGGSNAVNLPSSRAKSAEPELVVFPNSEKITTFPVTVAPMPSDDPLHRLSPSRKGLNLGHQSPELKPYPLPELPPVPKPRSRNVSQSHDSSMESRSDDGRRSRSMIGPIDAKHSILDDHKSDLDGSRRTKQLLELQHRFHAGRRLSIDAEEELPQLELEPKTYPSKGTTTAAINVEKDAKEIDFNGPRSISAPFDLENVGQRGADREKQGRNGSNLGKLGVRETEQDPRSVSATGYRTEALETTFPIYETLPFDDGGNTKAAADDQLLSNTSIMEVDQRSAEVISRASTADSDNLSSSALFNRRRYEDLVRGPDSGIKQPPPESNAHPQLKPHSEPISHLQPKSGTSKDSTRDRRRDKAPLDNQSSGSSLRNAEERPKTPGSMAASQESINGSMSSTLSSESSSSSTMTRSDASSCRHSKKAPARCVLSPPAVICSPSVEAMMETTPVQLVRTEPIPKPKSPFPPSFASSSSISPAAVLPSRSFLSVSMPMAPYAMPTVQATIEVSAMAQRPLPPLPVIGGLFGSKQEYPSGTTSTGQIPPPMDRKPKVQLATGPNTALYENAGNLLASQIDPSTTHAPGYGSKVQIPLPTAGLSGPIRNIPLKDSRGSPFERFSGEVYGSRPSTMSPQEDRSVGSQIYEMPSSSLVLAQRTELFVDTHANTPVSAPGAGPQTFGKGPESVSSSVSPAGSEPRERSRKSMSSEKIFELYTQNMLPLPVPLIPQPKPVPSGRLPVPDPFPVFDPVGNSTVSFTNILPRRNVPTHFPLFLSALPVIHEVTTPSDTNSTTHSYVNFPVSSNQGADTPEGSLTPSTLSSADNYGISLAAFTDDDSAPPHFSYDPNMLLKRPQASLLSVIRPSVPPVSSLVSPSLSGCSDISSLGGKMRGAKGAFTIADLENAENEDDLLFADGFSSDCLTPVADCYNGSRHTDDDTLSRDSVISEASLRHDKSHQYFDDPRRTPIMSTEELSGSGSSIDRASSGISAKMTDCLAASNAEQVSQKDLEFRKTVETSWKKETTKKSVTKTTVKFDESFQEKPCEPKQFTQTAL